MLTRNNNRNCLKIAIIILAITGFITGSMAIRVRVASADPYFNSSEPGCDGSNPNYLMCEDFEQPDAAGGHWYGEHCDTANANGGIDKRTKGWCGTIYANPITPSGAALCGGVGAKGTNCEAHGGLHPGSATTTDSNSGTTTINVVDTSTLPSSSSGTYKVGTDIISWTGKTATTLTGVKGVVFNWSAGVPVGKEGSQNMANHAFYPNRSQYREIYIRYYYKISADYAFGAEKTLTINEDIGVGGVSMAGAGVPWAGSGELLICPVYDCRGEHKINPLGREPRWFYLNQNVGNWFDFRAHRGNWIFIEMHLKLNTVGLNNDGVYELWIDDCGPTGTGCSGTPTKRAFYNNVQWVDPTFTQGWGSVWWENWANPPSAGTPFYDQIIVSKAGPIGFMGSGQTAGPPMLSPPAAPGSLSVR